MREAEQSLTNLCDLLQVLTVANTMIRQIQGQIGDQLGDSQRDEGRGSINAMGDDDNDRQGLIDSSGKSINIEHIAGVVDQTEIERLRRLIFRSTKGKSYMYI